MHACPVRVSRTVSGPERVGTDGTIPVLGREQLGNKKTIFNLGKERLGTRIREFRLESGNGWPTMGMVLAVTPFHFGIDEGMQPDARNKKSNKALMASRQKPINHPTHTPQPRGCHSATFGAEK